MSCTETLMLGYIYLYVILQAIGLRFDFGNWVMIVLCISRCNTEFCIANGCPFCLISVQTEGSNAKYL